MTNSMKAVPKLASKTFALEETRRTIGDSSSSTAPADPEVVAIARRRQFSAAERRRILAAADRCTEPGEIGALLRREGIYSSQLSTWRKRRTAEGTAGLDSRPRGRKGDPAVAEAQRVAKLTRQIARLQRQLAQAHLIIDVQKKVASLLALESVDDTDAGS
jgi:transposase